MVNGGRRSIQHERHGQRTMRWCVSRQMLHDAAQGRYRSKLSPVGSLEAFLDELVLPVVAKTRCEGEVGREECSTGASGS